jgi:hypothetical protein
LVADQLSSELPPLFTVVGLAAMFTVGAGVIPVIDTVTLASAERLEPVHASVNVDCEVSAVVVCVPDVALVPDQAPEAVQLVAFVDDHVSTEVPPLITLVGLALSETVGCGGAAVTVIVTLRCALPPGPLQESVAVVFEVRGPSESLPDVAFAPLQPPEAVQDVASVLDQVSVTLSPLVTLLTFELSVTVGGVSTGEVGGSASLPPQPVSSRHRAGRPANVARIIVRGAAAARATRGRGLTTSAGRWRPWSDSPSLQP